MTQDLQFLLLLAVIALFFITELIPLAITAMAVPSPAGFWDLSRPKLFLPVSPILQ